MRVTTMDPPAEPPPGPQLPTAPVDPLTADRDALSEPRRVSPFGPLFLAWAVIRRLGVVNLGIFTALVSTGNVDVFGFAASLVIVGIGAVQWWRFTYGLETTEEGDQLVTLSGVFTRNRTSVPLDRVQAVSTRQNLMHRVFNLVEVNVQTAGSMGAEVDLTAVRPDVAERIRRLSTVTSTSGRIEPAAVDENGVPPPPPEAHPLVHRSLGELLVIAFIRNPLLLLAPIPLAAGVGLELGDVLSGVSDRAGDALGDATGSTAAVILLVTVVLLISIAASTLLVVLRLFDLRLVVDGAGLRRLSGLVNRSEVTASVERVQLLRVQRNPLERLTGRHALVMPLAGAGGEARGRLGTTVPSAIDLPGTLDTEVDRIADTIFGNHRNAEPGHGDGSEISELAVRRWTLWLGFLPSAAAAAGLWWLVGGWAIAVVLWPPIVWFAARRRWRTWRWSLGPETIRVRYGTLMTVERTMPVRKTQNVFVRSGLFHRRHGLADVHIRTAGSAHVVVPLLPLAQAQALRDELLFRSETDPRPFM